MNDDVRDLRGRFHRLVISAVIGVVGSLVITFLLPTRDHFPLPPGSCGFGHGTGNLVEGGSIGMMIAGAVGIALATYAALGAWARSIRAPTAQAAIKIDLARCIASYRAR